MALCLKGQEVDDTKTKTILPYQFIKASNANAWMTHSRKASKSFALFDGPLGTASPQMMYVSHGMAYILTKFTLSVLNFNFYIGISIEKSDRICLFRLWGFVPVG